MCYKCQGSWQSNPCHFCVYDHRTRGNPWVKHCYGSVRLRRSSVYGWYGCRHPGARHWELLTSRGWKGLIEHIMQCMYKLHGPSWGPVTTFGYVITDSRIYPPPSPSGGAPNMCITFFPGSQTLSGHSSITIGLQTKSSAAIDRAPGARSKSDEFVLRIILFIEIWPLKV